MEEEQVEIKKPALDKYSYSKLSLFEQCAYRYKLKYVDKHFVDQPSIATDFGTLIHKIQELMAKTILSLKPIDYPFLLNVLENGYEDPEDGHIAGVKELEVLYAADFAVKDKADRTYRDKIDYYKAVGIYRLRDYLILNPSLEIVGIEQEFNLERNGVIYHGFIDLVLQDVNTGEITVIDYKTYTKPLERKDLTTPLQFVIYTLAAKELYNTTLVKCMYELPLCDTERQEAGTKGYMDRGLKKLGDIFTGIMNKEFTPHPSPLCMWCPFSKTYKDGQPENAKGLCPYFSHWTKDSPSFDTEYPWMGWTDHPKILEEFQNNGKHKEVLFEALIPNPIKVDKDRRFLIRR